MSSTSRGGKRSASDNYPTPAFAVHRLLERLELPGGSWLESSAGTGNIIKAVNAVRKDVNWIACELREECEGILRETFLDHDITGEIRMGDFLKQSPPPYNGPCVVSLNNCPFSLAQEFIEHTLHFAPHVIHLLRLNYLETAKRCEFFRSQMPDVYILQNRVSFTGNGKSDSTAYCWMHFGPERGRRTGKIEVLDHTPLDQRR